MNDAGYTATEALAALAIIGLAIGGLTSGMQVIGRAQSATSATLKHADAVRTANRKLSQLLAQNGPFRSDRPGDFQGDTTGFSFPCAAGSCGARVEGGTLVVTRGAAREAIVLPTGPVPTFRYGGTLSLGEVWPPPRLPPPAPQWQVLQSVALADSVSDTSEVVAVSHLWVQQAANCEFDTVIQDCRAVSP